MTRIPKWVLYGIQIKMKVHLMGLMDNTNMLGSLSRDLICKECSATQHATDSMIEGKETCGRSNFKIVWNWA